MKVIEISAAGKCTPTLALGKRGENLATEIHFDFSAWSEEFGSTGFVELYVKRKGDESAYPVTVTIDGTVAIWTVTATDTDIAGLGEAEFLYRVGETVVKSVVFGTAVEQDIGQPSETPPDPYETWLDTLTELAADTEDAAQRAAQSAEDAATAATEAAEEAVAPIVAALPMLSAGYAELTLSSYPNITCIVTAANTMKRSANGYRSKQIPIDPLWKGISVTANASYSTHITFVTEALPTTPTSGTSMEDKLATGETGRHVIRTGTTQAFSIPSDAAYAVISITGNGSDLTPASVRAHNTLGANVAGTEAEVVEINDILDRVKLQTVIAGGTVRSGIINASGKMSITNRRTTLEIANAGYSAITITAGDLLTHVSFLTASISGLSAGDAVSLCAGEPARHDIPADTTDTLTIPVDCTYIDFMRTYDGDNFMPADGYIFSDSSAMVDVAINAANNVRPSHSLETVTACIIGASVEAGQTHEEAGDSSKADPLKAYLTVALQNNGVTVTNLSHGGMGYLRRSSVSSGGYLFKDIIDETDFSAFDSVYLTLGSNDWNYDYALGTPADTGTTTVCGMLKYALEKIYASNPCIKVFVKTPGMRATKGDVSTLWGWNAPNAAATPYTLKDLHDAITDICEGAMVECMNDPTSGIINAYNILTVYPDGSHPNKATMALMAKNMTGRIALK